jgi:RsmE family RNA methyltransferase
MNWILLEEERKIEEDTYRLSVDQSIHIRTILKKPDPGSQLRGLLPGIGQGLITIESWEDTTAIISFSLNPVPFLNSKGLSLILPLPRPQTGKKILHLAGCFAVQNIFFYLPESKNKEYLTSPVYKPQSIKKEVRTGMEQSGSWTETKVSLIQKNLKNTITLVSGLPLYSFDPSGKERWADWLYKLPRTNHLAQENDIGLVFGSESGFKPEELTLLNEKTQIFKLGSSILRTEYAVSSVLFTLESFLESIGGR